MSLIFLARQNTIQMHVGTQYNFVIFMSIAAKHHAALQRHRTAHSTAQPHHLNHEPNLPPFIGEEDEYGWAPEQAET